eukprot:768701-Hanusia_phi.AAC.9
MPRVDCCTAATRRRSCEGAELAKKFLEQLTGSLSLVDRPGHGVKVEDVQEDSLQHNPLTRFRKKSLPPLEASAPLLSPLVLLSARIRQTQSEKLLKASERQHSSMYSTSPLLLVSRHIHHAVTRPTQAPWLSSSPFHLSLATYRMSCPAGKAAGTCGRGGEMGGGEEGMEREREERVKEASERAGDVDISSLAATATELSSGRKETSELAWSACRARKGEDRN